MKPDSSAPDTAVPDRILRLIVIGGSACVALVLLIFVGHHFFVRWQAPRLGKQAQLAVYRNQLTEASLLARRALQLDKDNVDAARAVAEIADRQGSREAITWRQRVLKALPNSAADRIALAWVAVHFKDLTLARETLAALPEADRQSADYHACAAELAAAMNHLEEADAHYAEAIRLDPKNKKYVLARALIELRLLDKRAAARETLRGLFGDPDLGISARRLLLADDLAVFDWPAALPVAKDLTTLPEATFNDRLIYLTVLKRSGSSELPAYLAELQAAAAGTPDNLAALLLWMQENGRALEAIAWVDTLPPASRATSNVKAAVALCHAALDEWPIVEAMVSTGNWEKWEYLRLAILARTMRERSNRDLFESTWETAVSAATGQPNGLQQLLRLTTAWGWRNELRNIYWALSDVPGAQNSSLSWLYQSYRQEENTPGLQRVTAKLAQLDPEDDNAKNNLVMFGLLLQRGTPKDFETARHLYEKHPGEATFTSTYAYSLLIQGKKDDALRTITALRPEQLEEPSTAAYYGIILTAKGNLAEAEKYLALARTGPLLPEEEKLVAEAEKKAKNGSRE